MSAESSPDFLDGIAADLARSAAVVLAARLPEPLEAERAGVMRARLDEHDRRRHSEIQSGRAAGAFLVTRAVLRTVLGHLLNRPPSEIELTTSGRGKPALARGTAPEIHFNTSHSRTHALIALSRIGDVGVDIEDIGRVDDRVVRRSLSKPEFDRLVTMDAERRAAAFYHLWTVKEACAKATGVGIGIGMRNVAASFGRTGRWRDFTWESIVIGPRLAAAVAVRIPDGAEPSGHIELRGGVLEALFGLEPGFAPEGGG